jgi:radical SAM protein with 4Fe4S-binding SPASM domain
MFFLGELNHCQVGILDRWIHVKYRLKLFLKHWSFDNFYMIIIETTTSCNRRCSYCPNSLYSREQKLMDFNLFKKIISDLQKTDYNGIIAPHLQGEPLLDNRMPELISYAKEKLPHAAFHIYTNGDFLTKETFDKLVTSGVNKFCVTEHENKKSPQFLSWYEKATFADKRKIIFKKINQDSRLSNKGGLIKVKKNTIKPIGNRCLLGGFMFTINVDGECLLCSNDFFGQYSFGNVKDKSIMEIWNDKKYKKIRRDLNRGKFNLDICKKCFS